MYLEYNLTACCYMPRFGDTFTTINGWRSFPDMAAAVSELATVGLKIGRQVASRTWRIELATERTAQ